MTFDRAQYEALINRLLDADWSHGIPRVWTLRAPIDTTGQLGSEPAGQGTPEHPELPLLGRSNPVWQVYGQTESHRCPCRVTLTLPSILAGTYVITYAAWWRWYP